MKKILPILALMLITLAGCVSTPQKILPDLFGLNTAQVEALLNEEKIDFEIQESNDFTKKDNIFVRYVDHVAGDELPKGEKAIVEINVHRLPDLTGKTENEIIELFNVLKKTISTTFDEGNNDFANLTWSGYVDYEVGKKISEITDKNIAIKIAINNLTTLPDLSGKNIHQIERELTALFVEYEFVYVQDDTKEADTFNSYVDFEAGDAIDDGTKVTINLYTNSFIGAEKSLFISKFWDNGGKNKAVEIYNPLTTDINLADYALAILSNGSLLPTETIQLTGVIEAGSTYIIANPEGNRSILTKAGLSSTKLVFDGNDVIQLRYKNQTYIDIISTIGSTVFSLTNEVYIRQANITAGQRRFSFEQWDEYVPTFVQPFGTHPYARPESFSIDMQFAGREFGNPLGGMVQVTFIRVADGDTAYFTPGFEDNARIRFIGVDTPETNPEVQPGGLAAKAYTENALTNASVIYLQSDPFTAWIDTYGRHIGYVWADGVMLNYELVKLGHSANYMSTENKLVYENRYIYRWFQDAEQYAKDNKLGIHGL